MKEDKRRFDGNLHYSEKGGHGARHDHWNGLRREYNDISSAPKELQWVIRRSMLRDPRSGR